MNDVSIVITTYKAVAHLDCCVQSLLRAYNPEGIEVVLYGDGGGEPSRDAIARGAEALRRQGYAVVAHYEEKNKGICGALNAACRMATGRWLFIINDDMVFPRTWRARVTRHLREGRVLSISAVEPPLPGRHIARCFHARNLGLDPTRFDFEGVDAFQEGLPDQPLQVGVNYPFLVERELFWSLGGVDERFAGPYHDPDLFLRFRLKGVEMLRVADAIVYHFSGMSLRFDDPDAQTEEGLRKRSRMTLGWIRRENQARLAFIRKWGAKPRARFGEIPATRAKEEWNPAKRSLWERTACGALVAWETFRALTRELRHRND